MRRESVSTASSSVRRRSLELRSASNCVRSRTLKLAPLGSPALNDSYRPPRKALLPSSQVNEGLRGMATYGGSEPAKPVSCATTDPIDGQSPNAEPNRPDRTQLVAVS